MTNEYILNIALRQSAVDMNCAAEDFLSDENKIVFSKATDKARSYLSLPFDCNLVSYGNNIVASIRPELEHAVQSYISTYPAVHCFETPNMHVLSSSLAEFGLKICFMAEYFLPDIDLLKKHTCAYETRILSHDDFSDLYLPQWSNALCKERSEFDVLGVGAYDGGRLIGLAGCSADCDSMLQIGIDVLPEYRRRGIASALISELALAAIERGKVPFYCAAWSNIRSVRSAIKCGFRPAWVELSAKSAEFVDEMNKRKAMRS